MLFKLGRKIKEKAQKVMSQMEKDGLEIAPLSQAVFTGFIVKDGIEGLQTEENVKNLEVLGSIVSESGTKYWISLKEPVKN